MDLHIFYLIAAHEGGSCEDVKAGRSRWLRIMSRGYEEKQELS